MGCGDPTSGGRKPFHQRDFRPLPWDFPDSLSVQVGGASTGLFGLEPPEVRVEVRAKGRCVSTPVSASYGFEEATGDVQLRASATDPKQIEPDTVTLMVDVDEIGQKTVNISLLDATSGAELANTTLSVVCSGV